MIPSIRMEISDPHWTHFLRILYLKILLKFTHISWFGFKSDTNHLLFRWRHIYIYMIGFYNKIRSLYKALRINLQFKHLPFYRGSRILRQFIRVLLDNQICVSHNIAPQKNTTICTSVFCEINTGELEESGRGSMYERRTLNMIPHF